MIGYEKVFAVNLGKKLAEQIYGKVEVSVVYDELQVHIQCWADIDCVIKIDNFTERIVNGWSTDYAAYEILERYRRIIIKRYFR